MMLRRAGTLLVEYAVAMVSEGSSRPCRDPLVSSDVRGGLQWQWPKHQFR
jgi:hypothetical protein